MKTTLNHKMIPKRFYIWSARHNPFSKSVLFLPWHSPSSSLDGWDSTAKTVEGSAFRMEKICKETTITSVS